MEKRGLAGTTAASTHSRLISSAFGAPERFSGSVDVSPSLSGLQISGCSEADCDEGGSHSLSLSLTLESVSLRPHAVYVCAGG